MNKSFITKENLKELIKNLKKDCDEFIAPKREHLNDIIFGDTKNDNKELLDYESNSVISPRAFLLPQTEKLFEIKSARDSNLAPIEDKKKRIFYGVRPCDIKAIGLMRRFFLDEFAPLETTEQSEERKMSLTGFIDVFYQQKLENSIFIALACGKRCLSKSFCHIMDTGPIAKDNFDLQLIPISRGYLMDVGSKKGNSILKKNKKLFAKANSDDEKEIKDSLKHFIGKDKEIYPVRDTVNSDNNTIVSNGVYFKKLAKIMKEGKVRQEIWNDIGLRCVVCSGCITLCPTCSCFSVVDRLNGDKGVRLRYCDGCVYAGFTRMAGGNIPQPQHKDHIRRFFEHKLNVDVDRYGTPSCVGCGRCIETCPGNIDIRKFIKTALVK